MVKIESGEKEHSMNETSVRDAQRLLLVMDRSQNLLSIKDALELRRGYEVITAENGREALEMLEQEQDIPDAIVSGVTMSEIDGYTFVENIRKDKRTREIIFLLVAESGEDKIRGLKLGADICMNMPDLPGELVYQIEALLKMASRRRENKTQISVPSDVHLTQTELKVLQFVVQGLAYRDIAEQLNVSQRAVESHISNMLGKTRLNNRTELVSWAIENQIT